ncbi:TPA: adhesin [Proteus mirabilis]|uniref:MrpH family fimbial adhesin n=1 Tax=Proteus mirabilis TaxID=584 RepID=UPI0023B33775|nr:adhesin [Proteus mirabilis]HEK3118085.1 adhesin [Proteus mirabilis]
MLIPKRQLIFYLFTSMLIYPASSIAAIFSYITESKPVGNEGTGADYTFIIQRWDPEPPTALNPCYKKKPCYITINHRHQPNQSGGSATRTILSDGHKYRRMEDLRIAVMKELGGFPYGPGVAIHRYVDTSTIQECVGIFYQPNAYGFAEDGYLLPGSICAIAPPPVGHCDVLAHSVELDYGNVGENELDNAVRSQTVNVTCNRDVSLQVVATGMNNRQVPLRNDNSLYADLYINDKSGEEGEAIFVAKGKMVSIQVSSKLRTNGHVAPGYFSGFGALILTLP